MAILHKAEIQFINGIFFCLHTGHIDEDDFWEIVTEADLDRAEVAQTILPHEERGRTIEDRIREGSE